MRKEIKFILYLVLFSISSYGQNSQLNLNKYWKYRQRFIQYYVSIGPNAGQSLPFNNRNINRDNPSYTGTDYIAGGESTINLGNYIALLATEYKLLSINNQNVSNTTRELYYALYAFNRLDLIAETANGYKQSASLNGFFVREDFPNNFNLAPININASGPNQNVYYEIGKGTPYIVNHTEYEGVYACDTTNTKSYFRLKYNHTPMSTDHFIGIVNGLVIANKCLDKNVTYLNNPFQDNEVFLLSEVKNILDRLLTKAQRDSWELREADNSWVGNCENTGKTTLTDHNGHLTQYSTYLAKIGFDVIGKIYSPAIVGQGVTYAALLSNKTYNVNMSLKILTLSNRGKAEVLKYSDKYNWKPYYQLLGNFLNNWQIKGLDKKCIELLIASAPCDGPFFHSINDLAPNGWASDNRFLNNIFIQNLGTGDKANPGNYSGIDFMLLYNLYRLSELNNNSLPKYTLNLTTPVDCINENIIPCKIKNCKRKVRRECRQVCRKKCKDECSKRKGWKKLICKWKCKKECKKECKDKLIKICP